MGQSMETSEAGKTCSLSVLDTRWRPIVPLKECATLREHLRVVGEAVAAALPARRAQALGAFSLQIYALAP